MANALTARDVESKAQVLFEEAAKAQKLADKVLQEGGNYETARGYQMVADAFEVAARFIRM